MFRGRSVPLRSDPPQKLFSYRPKGNYHKIINIDHLARSALVGHHSFHKFTSRVSPSRPLFGFPAKATQRFISAHSPSSCSRLESVERFAHSSSFLGTAYNSHPQYLWGNHHGFLRDRALGEREWERKRLGDKKEKPNPSCYRPNPS